MLELSFLVACAAVCGWGLVAAVLGQLPWLPSVFYAWGHHPRATRQICAVVAQALANQRDAGDAIEGLVPHQRMVYRQRLREAVSLLRSDPSSPVDALERSRSLPPGLLADLRAAAAVSPSVLERALRRAAEGGEVERSGLQGQLAATFPYVIVLSLVMSFIGVFILPKFDRIFEELGIRLPYSLEFVLGISRLLGRGWLGYGLLAVGVTFLLSAIIWGWHRLDPFGRRRRRGELLVMGLVDGRSEAELAQALAASWREAPRALSMAGERGDLAGVARACGWRITSPEALVAALERHRTRERWAVLVTSSLVRLLIPVVLAVPIYLLCLGIFQALYGIIGKLAE